MQGGVTRLFPGKNAKYSLTVGGPNGQDRLLALASTKPLNLNDVAQFAGDQGFAEVRLQGQDKLAQALSVIVNPLPEDAWTTDVLTFRVGNGGNAGGGVGTVTTAPGQSLPTPPAQEQPTAQIQPGEKQDGSFDAAVVGAYDRLKGDESLGRATSYAVPWGEGLWQKFRGVGAYGDAVLLHANGSSRAYAVHGRLLERYLALAKAENAAGRPPPGWAGRRATRRSFPATPTAPPGCTAFSRMERCTAPRSTAPSG